MDDGAAAKSAAISALARAELNELLQELLQRVKQVMDTQDRLHGLLDAVVGIAADLSLNSVLQRIITAACQLADARYGALGVPGSGADRHLREFVTHGLTAEQQELIGELPRGHGILGVLIDDPKPLRLSDLGEHALSYGFPPNHPPMDTFLGVPIRSRGSVYGNLYLTEKQGGDTFTAEDEQIVVALAAAAGVVIENARLYERIALQKRWLEVAADVTAALLGDGGRDAALAQVATRALDTAGADVTSVLLREGPGWVTAAVGGQPAGGSVGLRVASSDPLIDAVMRTGRMVVAADGTVHARTAEGVATPPGWPDAGSLVLLPLRTGGEITGILTIGWSGDRDDAFRETDLLLPAVFSEQITLALQLALAREDQARLAVLEDRDRIGRDLHDLVIQRLFAVGLTLENASRLIVRPEVAERVASAVDDLDATIKDIRRTIFQLSAPVASTDIRAKLAENVAMLVPALGLTPRLVTEGPVDTVITDAVRPHLLAVLREALSNVARHAAASSVDVCLQAGIEVVLTVRDDGRGIVTASRHSGLRNMLERAESLGGSCEVRRRPEGGTEVVWRVPANSPMSGAAREM